MNGKLCFQTVKLFIIQGEPIHFTIRFWVINVLSLSVSLIIYLCAVHMQVLQKSKTMCFTSSSKGTCVIVPFWKIRWSYVLVFLVKNTLFSGSLSPISVLSGSTNHKRRQRCAPAYSGRSCSAGRLERRACHKGNRTELWSRGIVTKGYSGVRIKQSHSSSTSRCCYWIDMWSLLLLGTGKVYHWDRRRAHR